MPQLSFRGVRKSYDRKEVLHGIDLSLADREFIVIVGPSGCGKSTLLRMIAGLEDITAGEIAMDGTRLNEIEPSRRGCSMMFQNYALYPHMTVEQNIGYPLRIAGVDRAERARKVQAAAAMLGLGDYLARRPAQLSGGQRQRVAMGRAIVREPKLFLFDEPLSNLDTQLRVQMRIELRRLHKRLGATSILVTHDQVEAMTLADRLVVMNGGHVEQSGRPAEIYANPASEFVATFLGAPPMNICDAEVSGPGQLRLVGLNDRTLATPLLDLPAGAKVRLGFRPEALFLAADGLPAIVDLVEELGSMRVAYCHVGDNEFAIALPSRSDVRENAKVHLKIAAEDMFFFDKGSSKRIYASKAVPETPACIGAARRPLLEAVG